LQNANADIEVVEILELIDPLNATLHLSPCSSPASSKWDGYGAAGVGTRTAESEIRLLAVPFAGLYG
jgi:hypothetical protein